MIPSHGLGKSMLRPLQEAGFWRPAIEAHGNRNGAIIAPLAIQRRGRGAVIHAPAPKQAGINRGDRTPNETPLPHPGNAQAAIGQGFELRRLDAGPAALLPAGSTQRVRRGQAFRRGAQQGRQQQD